MSWRITPALTWNETVWNPSMIQTALWLDAADASTVTTVSGAVSQWNDKSGNARHAAQSNASLRPTYSQASQNGRNTIAVNTLGQYLIYQSGGLLSNVGAGFVFAVAAVAGTNATTRTIIQIATSVNNTRLSLFRNASNVLQTGGRRENSNTFQSISDPSNLGSGYNLCLTLVDYVFTGLELWKNGSLVAGMVGPFQNTGNSASDGGNYAIANSVLADASNFTGNIAEIIVGHGNISRDNQYRIEGYLAHKWGLTANLPSGHPYKTVGPTP